MTVEELSKDLDKRDIIGTKYYYQGMYREVIGYRLSQGLLTRNWMYNTTPRNWMYNTTPRNWMYNTTQYTNNDVYLIYTLKTKQGSTETIVNTFSPVDGLSYNLSPFTTSYSDLLKKIKHYYDFSGYYKNPEDLWKDILKWRKVLGYEED